MFEFPCIEVCQESTLACTAAGDAIQDIGKRTLRSEDGINLLSSVSLSAVKHAWISFVS